MHCASFGGEVKFKFRFDAFGFSHEGGWFFGGENVVDCVCGMSRGEFGL